MNEHSPNSAAAPALGDRKHEAYRETFDRLRPPPITDAVAERRHRKERLAAGCRIFAALGLAEGIAGHISARDSVDPDTFWVNPFSLGFGRVRVSDLVRVDRDGGVVEGDGPVNVSAFAIHYEIHAARPDVVAAAHTHSTYGKAWSAVGRLLDPISQDACVFFEDHAFVDDTRVLVTDAGEGACIARALGPHKAAILRNHGLLTVGRTVDEAVWWFVAMERCCQAQFLVESVSRPLMIDAENARAARDVSGSSFVGWLQCQPLWQRMVAEQRDLLD